MVFNKFLNYWFHLFIDYSSLICLITAVKRSPNNNLNIILIIIFISNFSFFIKQFLRVGLKLRTQTFCKISIYSKLQLQVVGIMMSRKFFFFFPACIYILYMYAEDRIILTLASLLLRCFIGKIRPLIIIIVIVIVVATEFYNFFNLPKEV